MQRILICAVVAYAHYHAILVWLPALEGLPPIIPDQPGARAMLHKVFEGSLHSLAAEQVASFKKDGVIHIPGLIPSPEVIRALEPLIALHTHPQPVAPNRINGAIREILRAAPLRETAAPLFGNAHPSTLGISDLKVWHKEGRTSARLDQCWHSEDFHLDWQADRKTFVVLWLALTDAPRAIEFLPHKYNETRDLIMKCRFANAYGICDKDNETLKLRPGGECVMRTLLWQEQNQLSKSVGGDAGEAPVENHPGIWAKDLKAGDALIFHGQTLHRGLSNVKPRTAMSMIIVNDTPQNIQTLLDEQLSSKDLRKLMA